MNDTPKLPQATSGSRDIVTEINGTDFKVALKSLLLSEFSSPERFTKMLFNALRANPKLGQCSKNSLVGAMMLAASFNLEPNTPSQMCHILPYKKKYKEGEVWKEKLEAQFQIGYRGFIEIASRSPRLIVMQAEAVHENDEFDRQLGTETRLTFKQAKKDRGEIIGSFCYIRFMGKSGIIAEDSTYIDIDEIKKIRDQSETWKSLIRNIADAGDNKYKEVKARKAMEEAAWSKWIGQMAIKSVIKRQFKKYPLSPEMKAATAIDDGAETGLQNLSTVDVSTAKGVVSEGDATLLITENMDEESVDSDYTEDGYSDDQEQPKETRKRQSRFEE